MSSDRAKFGDLSTPEQRRQLAKACVRAALRKRWVEASSSAASTTQPVAARLTSRQIAAAEPQG